MSNAFINIPSTKFLDNDGYVSREWRLWLMNPQVQTIGLGGIIVGAANGGTGLNTVGTPQQVLTSDGYGIKWSNIPQVVLSRRNLSQTVE